MGCELSHNRSGCFSFLFEGNRGTKRGGGGQRYLGVRYGMVLAELVGKAIQPEGEEKENGLGLTHAVPSC